MTSCFAPVKPAGFEAQHLAEQGFIMLAYSASYQRESGGEARREGMGTISYEERMKRLRNAAEATARHRCLQG